jgi:multidrug efflux pump subunit AcrB
MFALVLAIGLLVDDAIVVVENVERVMTFEGLAPKPATPKAMGQITGALVGIVLVLTAVFLPMAFFSGVTGVIYRQFSVTIAAAMILSVLVAMTITPALCGSILHQIQGRPSAWRPRRRAQPAGQVLHLVQPPLRAHLQRPAPSRGWLPRPAHAGRGVLPGAERGHRPAAVAPAGRVPAR